MRIHALSTGSVQLKHSFLHARSGWSRQLRLFMPDEWSDPLPIHCWVIEHEEAVVLVDTGETAAVNNIPFARFTVRPEDELPAMLATVGIAPTDLTTIILTHMHGDHMDGAVHVGRPVLVSDHELRFSRGVQGRMAQRLLRQPVPAGVDFREFAIDEGPIGAFARSRRLTADGRIRAVATPGHTVGHLSVLCIDDDGHHVLLAGDSTDTLEQLHALRPDAIGPKPKVSIETMQAILAHGAQHPTVYLPSHDLDSARRLRERITL